MTDQQFDSAKALKATIQKINDAQAKIAQSGARVHIRITNAAGSQELVDSTDLIGLITQNTYNTICATALTTINTNLASAKTTAQDSFDDITAS